MSRILLGQIALQWYITFIGGILREKWYSSKGRVEFGINSSLPIWTWSWRADKCLSTSMPYEPNHIIISISKALITLFQNNKKQRGFWIKILIWPYKNVEQNHHPTFQCCQAIHQAQGTFKQHLPLAILIASNRHSEDSEEVTNLLSSSFIVPSLFILVPIVESHCFPYNIGKKDSYTYIYYTIKILTNNGNFKKNCF